MVLVIPEIFGKTLIGKMIVFNWKTIPLIGKRIIFYWETIPLT